MTNQPVFMTCDPLFDSIDTRRIRCLVAATENALTDSSISDQGVNRTENNNNINNDPFGQHTFVAVVVASARTRLAARVENSVTVSPIRSY